jgi:hypothetical protein
MRKPFVKYISIFLAVAFLSIQVDVAQTQPRFQNARIAVWGRGGNPAFHALFGEMSEPDAIGNGLPLHEFVKNRKLPLRISLTDDIAQKLREAIKIAIRLNIQNVDKIVLENDRRIAMQGQVNLAKLQLELKKRSYLFSLIATAEEHYLAGFECPGTLVEPGLRGVVSGLSIETINRLYGISPELLSQYINHAVLPEKDIVVETLKDDGGDPHGNVYARIQAPIYGEGAVKRLDLEIGKLVNEKVAVASMEQRAAHAAPQPEVAKPQTPEELIAEITESLPVWAEYFKTLIHALAEQPEKTYYFGLDTDIGRSCHQEAQLVRIHKVVREIREISPNLITEASKGETLAARVLDMNENGQLELRNVFIVAQMSNVQNADVFRKLREKKEAWIIAINDEEPDGVYLPIFETATLALMVGQNADRGTILAFYNSIAGVPLTAEELEKAISLRVIYVLPRAAKIRTQKRRELYDLSAKVHGMA